MPLYLRDTTYAGGTNLGTTLTYGQLDGNFIFLDQKINTASVISTTGSTIYSTTPEAGPATVGASANNAIFLGYQAGWAATGAQYSIFLGNNVGLGAYNAKYSNFIGDAAGASAASAEYSNFLGAQSGDTAGNASFSNFLGFQVGYRAANASNSNFIGFRAGWTASSADHSNFIGYQAGYEATNAKYSNFLGAEAGYQATSAERANFLGSGSGYLATNAAYSNFLGHKAGYQATNADTSNFIGYRAGLSATNARTSTFLGELAGESATHASGSNFIGYQAGYQATSAARSNLIGYNAGNGASKASYSTLIGYQAGYNAAGTGVGRNNIIIGTNISLPDSTQNAVNIGGIIFATGSYSTTSGNPLTTPVGGAKVGIGTSTPQFTLDVSGSVSMINLTVSGSLVRSVVNYDADSVGALKWSMTRSLADIHMVNPNYSVNQGYPTMSMPALSTDYDPTTPLGAQKIVVNTSFYDPLRLVLSNFDIDEGRKFYSFTGQSTEGITLEPNRGVRLTSLSNVYNQKIWMYEPLGPDFFASQTGSLSNTRITGSLTISGSINVSGSIVPSVAVGSYTSSFSLGSSTAAWKDLWIANGTINFVDPTTGEVQGTLAAPGESNFLGVGAGEGASAVTSSNFIGKYAGRYATNAQSSNFFGSVAGYQATSAENTNFIGNGAGGYSTNTQYSNFIGISAGQQATNAFESNFIGDNAGAGAVNVNYSNFIGFYTAQSAEEASYSNFMGYQAGYGAVSASYSNFIGAYAGGNALNTTYSTLIGYKAGYRPSGSGLGSNNIIIGTNISLPDSTQNAVNIGGIIFATGSNSDLGDTLTTAVAGGMVGIGTSTPSSTLDVSGSLAVAGTATLDGFVILSQVSASLNFVDDAAAAAGGVPLGGLYRNGNFVLIRLS